MKLTRLELAILRLIRKEYPIPYDPLDKSVIGVGERPLLTDELIRAKFKTSDIDSVEKAVARLLAFQCVAKVYLFSSSEYAEQWIGGKTIRLVVMKPPAGQNCYQITSNGEETFNRSLRQRAKRVLSSWVAKLLEEYVPLAVAFLLGILLSSLFGFDLKQLRK